MFNWLLLVGSDGTSDVYTKTEGINYPSVILGIIIGIIISAFVGFLIVVFKNPNKETHTENKDEEK